VAAAGFMFCGFGAGAGAGLALAGPESVDCLTLDGVTTDIATA